MVILHDDAKLLILSSFPWIGRNRKPKKKFPNISNGFGNFTIEWEWDDLDNRSGFVLFKDYL